MRVEREAGPSWKPNFYRWSYGAMGTVVVAAAAVAWQWNSVFYALVMAGAALAIAEVRYIELARRPPDPMPNLALPQTPIIMDYDRPAPTSVPSGGTPRLG